MTVDRDLAATVLVVEDAPDIRELLRAVLSRAGYPMLEARSGSEGLRLFHEHRPDIVILDVGLPDMEGWDVLTRLRELADTPVLMLTALGHEADKVRGLNAGADDYLVKPFGPAELLARINAALRRAPLAEGATEKFVDDGLVVDFVARTVRVDSSAEIVLTPLEWRLLAAFVRHPGQTLSADQLLELAWDDPHGIGPDRVKFAVRRLRGKLAGPPDIAARIESVRGFGYRYARAAS